MPLHPESLGSRERMRLLIKRAGMAGFVFFLAKGLLWLIVSGVLVMVGSDL